MERLDYRLCEQLDTLIPFMHLASEEIFGHVLREHQSWMPVEHRKLMPDSYLNYERQVAHAAFLLGYAYFEAFVADLVRAILVARPQLLPGEKQLKYSDILAATSTAALKAQIIDREVVAVMYGSVDAIAKHFGSRFNIQWPVCPRLKVPQIQEANFIRNCLLHNGGRADERLAALGKWKEGMEITLTTRGVNQFGMEGRSVALTLFEEACKHHLGTGKRKRKK